MSYIMHGISLCSLSAGLAVLVLSSNLIGTEATLTDDEKEEILNAHNYFRRNVNPIATNMEELVSLCYNNGCAPKAIIQS